MPLIPHRPWWDLERFFKEEMPDLKQFGRPSLREPKMDIYEDDGNLVAEVELPGVDPDNIDIEIKDNVLKVEAKAEKKEEKEEKGYYKKELSRGYYKRAVRLPAEVKDKKAEASYEDGVLKVIIPKAKPKKKKEEKGTKVKVKSA